MTAGANAVLGLQFAWANIITGKRGTKPGSEVGNGQPITFGETSILTSVAASSSLGTWG